MALVWNNYGHETLLSFQERKTINRLAIYRRQFLRLVLRLTFLSVHLICSFICSFYFVFCNLVVLYSVFNSQNFNFYGLE